MSITPTPPASHGPPTSPLSSGPQSGGRNSLDQSPESRAHESEKDAQTRIRTASYRVGEAEKETEQKLSELKDEYVGRSLSESNRQEASIESQKQKGYQAVRDLQRSQQAELSRLKRDGDRTLGSAKEYYQTTIYNTEKDGDGKLQDLKSRFGQEQNYQQRLASADLETTQKENEHRIQEFKQTSDDRFAAIHDSAQKEFEKLSEGASQSSETSQKRFQERLDNEVQSQHDTLDSINRRGTEKLKEIRLSTSEKLAAYASRQRDPFYKLQDMKASLVEKADCYVLTAQIPEYEQAHFNVSIRGNELVIAGRRRNEEKVELEPGHVVATQAFQNYSESFPMTWPVDAKQLSREFNGDMLTVTVPKKTDTPSAPQHQPKIAERTRVERPFFPENIPHVAHESVQDPNSAEPGAPIPASPGSRTLV